VAADEMITEATARAASTRIDPGCITPPQAPGDSARWYCVRESRLPSS